MGCASGKGAGPLNIFGNKYGQNLAAVQIARERRAEAKRLREEEEEQQQAAAAAAAEHHHAQQQQAAAAAGSAGDSDDGDEETDDDTDDEDDYGPSPAAGIWAGSQKLQAETDKIAEGDDDEEEQPAAKKVKR